MIYFFIFYYFTSNVKIKQSYLFLRDFGFLKNGKFEFIFNNTKHHQIFVGLCTSNEISFISKSELENNYLPCDLIKQRIYVNRSQIISINQKGHGSFSGKIDRYGWYTPLIITCNENQSKSEFLAVQKTDKIQSKIDSTFPISQYTLSVRFSNLNSFLDSRKIPCLYIKPASVLLFGLLIIFWIVNWILNFTLKNPLHLYLTVTFLVTFVYVIIDTLKLYHDNVSDDPTPLSTCFVVFRCFHELLLLTAMMLAAKGWCIIIETIEINQILSSVFYTIMFSIPILILDTQALSIYMQLAMMVIGLAGCFLYYNVLVTSIDEANSIVSAHMLVISQSGIDPETTPIQKKFQIFNMVSNSVVLYFSIMMFRTVLFELLHLPDYIMTVIYDTATLSLLVVIAWLFKLKKSLRKGYMMVGENDEHVEFTLDDIEKLNEDRDEIQKSATTAWKEGMPLPAQPIVIRNSSSRANDLENDKNINNNTTENEDNTII